MDPLISRLAASLPAAKSLEQLTRPLLDMLGAVTGMESTYLTTIDLERDVQRVCYARNGGDMVIPEGLEVTWSDTLCKRALDENCTYTQDVAARWADSDAARALGLQTYFSAPVRSEDGHLLGTLCAASGRRLPLPQDAPAIMALFSSLVAGFIEREMLMRALQAANTQLLDAALRDPLTGLPNRRALYEQLVRLLQHAPLDGNAVLVGMLDLDGFKQINDQYGHQAGDALLCAVGARIAAILRAGDMAGRLGGDEFLVLATGSQGNAAQAAAILQQRILEATCGDYTLPGVTLRYAGASTGVIAILPDTGLDADAALRLADMRMYDVKRERRSQPRP